MAKLPKEATVEVRKRIEAEIEKVRREIGKAKYFHQRRPLIQRLGGLKAALDLFPKE